VSRAAQHPPTLIGWAARALSLLVIGGIALLLALEMAAPERPVRIVAEPLWGEVEPAGRDGAVMVPVRIVNRGSKAVLKVKIAFPGASADPAEVELELLGSDEERVVTIRFDQRPARLDYQVVGYEAS
jgi:uncharacterized protein (TIGR02588 family)